MTLQRPGLENSQNAGLGRTGAPRPCEPHTRLSRASLASGLCELMDRAGLEPATS